MKSQVQGRRNADTNVADFKEDEVVQTYTMQGGKPNSVFAKIGSPTHFPALKDLKISKISLAWEGLFQYMLVNGVELNVCSPNISAFELYRFTTEELFNFEIEDYKASGGSYSFIYDDFYPDHKYDNSRAAVDDCISYIFSKKTFEWMHFFRNDNLTLNQHTGLSKEDLKIRICLFQGLFRSFSTVNIRAKKVFLKDNQCSVSGSYCVTAETATDLVKFEGDWIVQFEFTDEPGFWQITRVNIKGVSL